MGNPLLLQQFSKYFIVGGGLAVLDIAAFRILTVDCGINHLVANTCCITVGTVLNYLLSSVWVFRQRRINVKRDFLPFAVIGLIALCLQNGFLFILINGQLAFTVNQFFGFDKNTVMTLSKIFVVGITFIWNFFARKYLVFDRSINVR